MEKDHVVNFFHPVGNIPLNQIERIRHRWRRQNTSASAFTYFLGSKTLL